MSAQKIREVPVLVIGGGPAGATLAADLGWRGAGCLLVDETDGTNQHPRANMAGQRSMEIFRRWGLAERMLAASLPFDYPIDVIFSTRLNGFEITRFSLGSTAAFQTAAVKIPDIAWSPYFKTQIGQNFIEPVVCEFARSFDKVEVRHNWRLVSFTQDDAGVTAEIEKTDGSARETVHAQYMVGCDGGRSLVRRTLGIEFTGRGVLARNQSIYFDAPEFLKSHPRGRGTLLWTLAPELRGVFITIDGNCRWTYNTYFIDENDTMDSSRAHLQGDREDDPDQGAFGAAMGGLPGRGGALPQGAGVPVRRFGAPVQSHWWVRYEHSHCRCGRSWVEVCGSPRRLGRQVAS